MTGLTAIVLLGYNLPRQVGALAAHVQRHTACPYELFLVDNGSSMPLLDNSAIDSAGVHIIRVPHNARTGGALTLAMVYLRSLAATREQPYFAYWYLQTNNEFVAEADHLSPLVEFLAATPTAAAAASAYTPDSPTHYKHLRQVNPAGFRPAWMLDAQVCFRASWLDMQPLPDARLTTAWGYDLELAYWARTQGYGLYVHDGLPFAYHPKSVAVAGAGTEDAAAWSARGRREMHAVYGQKYGAKWRELLTNTARNQA